MDNGIEWLRSDSSKFIFHYKLENIHSIGDEKKDHNWKVNAPLLSSQQKKAMMMNAFHYLLIQVFIVRGNGNQTIW